MKPFLVVQASGRARVGDVVAASSPLREVTTACVFVPETDTFSIAKRCLRRRSLGAIGEHASDFVSRCAHERFGPLVAQLTRVLATIDPLSLVSRGAPLNEYESEAETILLGLQGCTLRHVEQVIDAEFVHGFGGSPRPTAAACRRIAVALVERLPRTNRLSGLFLHHYMPASRNPASGRIVHVRAQPMN